jgi:hypothetical protein
LTFVLIFIASSSHRPRIVLAIRDRASEHADHPPWMRGPALTYVLIFMAPLLYALIVASRSCSVNARRDRVR